MQIGGSPYNVTGYGRVYETTVGNLMDQGVELEVFMPGNDTLNYGGLYVRGKFDTQLKGWKPADLQKADPTFKKGP